MLKLVKPVADRRVRDPADRKHRPIPGEGKVVTWSAYWHRREADGDVTVEDAPTPEDEQPSAKGDAAPATAASAPSAAPKLTPPAPPAADGKA